MPYLKKLEQLSPCPVETVLAIVAGKWKVRILHEMIRSEHTFGELRRVLGDVTQPVLAAQLKALCRDDIVERTIHRKGKTGWSTYALTEVGRTLIPVLGSAARWGQARLDAKGLVWNRARK